MKRRLVAGIVCALIGAALALLAADVSSWRAAFTRDDIRFRATPSQTDLWTPKTILPGDPAATLLGTTGSVRWRRALQAFWATRTEPGISQPDTVAPTRRANAQQRLLTQLASAPTRGERSDAANLLGVLVITTPAGTDQRVLTQLVRRAETYFKEAIAIDPGNGEAKENLELVLRLKRPGKGGVSRQVRSRFGFSNSHGTGATGGGY
jgi:hypothetical protein